MELDNKIAGVNQDIKSIASKVNLLRNENEEIEKRKLNIIVKGIPESPDKPDEDLANEVLRNICDYDMEFSKVERIGRNREDGKPRPMKIRFHREEDRSNAIKNATKIRKAKNVTFDTKIVFIMPDMTKLQRDEDLELRKCLSEKRLTDPNWIIRHGRLVKKKTDQGPVDPSQE